MQQLDDYREGWIAQALLPHLDILLDIVLHPPDLSRYSESDQNDFHYELQTLLADLARREPAVTIPKLTPLIKAAPLKTPIIYALADVASFESYRMRGKNREWKSSADTSLIDLAITALWSLHNEADQLSNDEVVWWAEGLCAIGGPTKPLVLQLYRELPASRADARQEIEIYLDPNTEEWKPINQG